MDQQLRILRFTPSTTEVINLIGSDVGRPVGHIVSNLENYNCLAVDIQEVLDTLIPKELEVRNSKGDWFTLSILPYRTMDNVIEGAVINFVNITRRKQMEEELKKQLTEKEILLREVHHRIKNNLASVESLLSMQMTSVSNKEALSVLQDAAGRVKSMKVLYDRLLIQEGYEESSVKSYIEGLIVSLKNLYFGEVSLEIERRIEDFELPPNKLFPLGIVINELLTNAMKHAFEETGGFEKLILVAVTKTKNHVRLTLEDNGCGLPEDFAADGAGGFGLTLVRMLTEQLGGSYTIENREGAGGSRSIVEFEV